MRSKFQQLFHESISGRKKSFQELVAVFAENRIELDEKKTRIDEK